MENIVVGAIVVGFLALTVWGVRVDRFQARQDAAQPEEKRKPQNKGR